MSFEGGSASAINIAVAAPGRADLVALIAESRQELLRHYPAQEVYSLSPEDMATPNCQVLMAFQNDQALGCVALLDCISYGEIKALFVRVAFRGLGLGRGLMQQAELLAGDIGLRQLRLETGTALGSAMTLYKALGYRERGAFGGYAANASSVFLEKRLY